MASLMNGCKFVLVVFFLIVLRWAPAGEMKMQRVPPLGDQDTFAGQRYARIGGVGNVGEKHTLPNRCALGAVHVLHVEHVLGKTFVENPWLHFKRNLRAFELILKVAKRGQPFGGEVKSV